MGRINVLHLYQNSKTGGIQQQILNLLGAYDRELVHPVFCCLGPRKEIADEMQHAGVEVIALGYQRKNRFHPSMVTRLARILREKEIHVLRTHKYRSNLYGRLAALMARTPVVVASEHNIYVDKELRIGRRTANRVLARWTDRVVAVSGPIRDDVIKYDRVPPEKTLVIHNGAVLDRFQGELKGRAVRSELGVPEDAPLLGFVGRLVPSKGLSYLLEAMALVVKEHPDARLMLTGEGALLDELREQAEGLGLHNNVIFTGNRRDIPDVLDAMDVFVLPSVKEGLPNSIIEAMAAGKPIVATPVGGVPEIVEDGRTGLLVQPRRPAELSQTLLRLISDRELAARVGREARAFALAHHSMEATAHTWQDLYLELLAAKGVRV